MDPGVGCRLIGGPHMEGERGEGGPVSDGDLDVDPRERHVQPRRVGHIRVRRELKNSGYHLSMPEGQGTRHPAVGDLTGPGDAIGDVLDENCRGSRDEVWHRIDTRNGTPRHTELRVSGAARRAGSPTIAVGSDEIDTRDE